MTIGELKKLIEIGAFRDYDELCVAVSERGFPATPKVKVTNIGSGIDYDSGKAIIYCECKLMRKPKMPHKKKAK